MKTENKLKKLAAAVALDVALDVANKVVKDAEQVINETREIE